MPTCVRCGRGPHATCEFRRSKKVDEHGAFVCHDTDGCKRRQRENRRREKETARVSG